MMAAPARIPIGDTDHQRAMKTIASSIAARRTVGRLISGWSSSHALGQINNSRRRGKAGDPSGPKGGRPLSRPADLHNRHLLVGLQSEPANQRARSDVGRASHTADADAFSFEVLGRFDVFIDHQLVGQRIQIAGNQNQIGSGHDSACHATAGSVADLHITGDQARNARGRAWNKEQIGIEAVFFVKTALFRQIPDRVAALQCAMSQTDFFLREGLAWKRTEQNE